MTETDLLTVRDAQVWATEFTKTVLRVMSEAGDQPAGPILESLSLVWFANAMETAANLGGLEAALEQAKGEVFACNIANGWFEEGRSFGDEIALLHSEISEALEAFRDFKDTETRFETPSGTQVLTQAEVNDLVAAGDYVLRDGCYFPVVRIEAAEDEPAHERIGVKALKPVGVASEAADELVRLLDFAHRHNFNLGHEFAQKLAYNRTRGHRHGGKAM
jgi:hypothetical protein